MRFRDRRPVPGLVNSFRFGLTVNFSYLLASDLQRPIYLTYHAYENSTSYRARRCGAGLSSHRIPGLHAGRLSRPRGYDRHRAYHGLARGSAHQPLHLSARYGAARGEHRQHGVLDLEIRHPVGCRLRHRHHRRHERGRAGRQPAVPARIRLRTPGRYAPGHGTEHLDAVCAG